MTVYPDIYDIQEPRRIIKAECGDMTRGEVVCYLNTDNEPHVLYHSNTLLCLTRKIKC